MGEIVDFLKKRKEMRGDALLSAEAKTHRERGSASEELEKDWLLNALSEDVWTARHRCEDLLAEATPEELKAAGNIKREVRRHKLLPRMFEDIMVPAEQPTEENKIERIATAVLFLELTDLSEVN